MMRKNRLFLSPPCVDNAEEASVAAAFATNYVAPCGPQVEAFELAMAELTGLPHTVALSSATAALHLLYRELWVTAGSVVVAPTLTFVASVAPAVQMGAEVVFVDADPATWMLDPLLVREALHSLRAKGRHVAAVVAVDLYGQCCDYDALAAACDEYDVPLVIDAAEALGATYRGRAAGDAGVAAVYSFNGNKIITTSGGGLLAAHDAALVQRARYLSQQARDPVAWYEHRELGYNYRMSNIVAAIGLAQLAKLERFVAQRRRIFDWYTAHLAGCEWVAWMPEAAYGRASRWLSVALLEGDGTKAPAGEPGVVVERVRQALERANIESRPLWKPMHLQPVFAGATILGGSVAEHLFARGLCLPSGSAMTADDVEEVCAIIVKVMEQRRDS